MRNSLKLRIPAAWRMCSVRPFFLGWTWSQKVPNPWRLDIQWKTTVRKSTTWRYFMTIATYIVQTRHLYAFVSKWLIHIDPTCRKCAKHCSVGSSLRWLWALQLWILCRRGPAVSDGLPVSTVSKKRDDPWKNGALPAIWLWSHQVMVQFSGSMLDFNGVASDIRINYDSADF